MSDLGIGGFVSNWIIEPIWGTVYEVLYRSVDAMTGGAIKDFLGNDYDPQNDGASKFLSLVFITVGSVLLAALAIRLFIIFEWLRKA